jgi:UDP-N-acetylmuramate dehydrogenase
MADLDAVRRDLRNRVRGEVRADEPLAAHTTLRVGGPAAVYVRAEHPEDLAAVGDVCHRSGYDWLVVGRGSNLLVADSGLAGVAIELGRAFRGVDIAGEELVAGAAEPMPALAQKAAAAGLGGVTFGVAIPGTIGGAVRMNAGAHGHELRDVLQWAELARLGDGRIERWTPERLRMRYRETDLPADAVVVRACLRLSAADAEQLRADMAEMRRWRRQHQPINEPSCGSVFRNPPGDSAGRLVEAAGMMGHRVGGARISEVHANFIITQTGATAADAHDVIQQVREAVARHSGIHLQTEVIVVGFDGPAGERGRR